MQKGFATIEIILAVMIIAVLVSFAVPNTVRLIDRVSLDYETKKLYSDLRFLQELNRSGNVNTTGTISNEVDTGTAAYMMFTEEPPAYKITRGLENNSPFVREPYRLRNCKKISFKYEIQRNAITFNGFGNATNVSNGALSNTLILTSQLGKKKYIKFDSVGRIRASLTDD